MGHGPWAVARNHLPPSPPLVTLYRTPNHVRLLVRRRAFSLPILSLFPIPENVALAHNFRLPYSLGTHTLSLSLSQSPLPFLYPYARESPTPSCTFPKVFSSSTLVDVNPKRTDTSPLSPISNSPTEYPQSNTGFLNYRAIFAFELDLPSLSN